MNVTLEIKGADLSKEVGTILSELSKEEKIALARDIMLTWMKTPLDQERTVYRNQVIDKLIEEKKSSNSYNWRADHEKPEGRPAFEKEYEYEISRRMGSFKSSKEQMIEMVVSESIAHYKSLVTELVKTDQQLADIWEKMKPKLEEQFPRMVHDSVTNFFAGQMQHIAQSLQQNFMLANNAEMNVQQVRNAVGLPAH